MLFLSSFSVVGPTALSADEREDVAEIPTLPEVRRGSLGQVDGQLVLLGAPPQGGSAGAEDGRGQAQRQYKRQLKRSGSGMYLKFRDITSTLGKGSMMMDDAHSGKFSGLQACDLSPT